MWTPVIRSCDLSSYKTTFIDSASGLDSALIDDARGALYTCICIGFKTKVLRNILDNSIKCVQISQVFQCISPRYSRLLTRFIDWCRCGSNYNISQNICTWSCCAFVLFWFLSWFLLGGYLWYPGIVVDPCDCKWQRDKPDFINTQRSKTFRMHLIFLGVHARICVVGCQADNLSTAMTIWPSLNYRYICFFYLTHCGLVTPYGGRDLGQHWLR